MSKPSVRRSRRACLAALATVAFAVAVTAEPAGAHTVTRTASSGSVTPPMPVAGMLGIDVASHQHPNGQAIDWARVKRSGVKFAYIKTDEGAQGRAGRYVNPWFSRDWREAGNAGVSRGAYHYARPRLPVSTAAADARQFVATVGNSMGELPPVLDLVAPVLGTVGLIAAALDAGGSPALALLRTLTGAAFLGAVSDAMLLGHWYLVQPGLPRRLLNEIVTAVGWTWPVEVLVM